MTRAHAMGLLYRRTIPVQQPGPLAPASAVLAVVYNGVRCLHGKCLQTWDLEDQRGGWILKNACRVALETPTNNSTSTVHGTIPKFDPQRIRL